MLKQTRNFPFTAVSGQASFKLALILTAINPAIGGVLISGPRGSAKSTLARGLADIMPTESEKSHDFVTLPLGASEEMLVGTLNLQKVLSDQSVAFQPGLLAKADGGVLYVDEVNLLPDNLVDLLLDVSTSGINRVERDGVSHTHSAEFILLGTMNPDEGELRPQLLDRFGLSVELSNQYSIEERVEIVQLREAFDCNPEPFIEKYSAAQKSLTSQIQQAKALLDQVQCSHSLRVLMAEKCVAAQVDGLRGDIVWYRAAVAHAAWHQRLDVIEDDVTAVEELVLAHRRQHNGNASGGNSSKDQTDHHSGSFSRPPETRNESSTPPSSEESQSASSDSTGGEGDWGNMAAPQGEAQNMPSLPWKVDHIQSKLTPASAINKAPQKFAGNHGLTRGKLKGDGAQGRFSSDMQECKVDWFASLIKRARSPMERLKLNDLVFRKKRQSQPVLHLVLLDTSASVLKQQSFSQAKSLVSAIANQAYLAREQMTLMGFGNQQVTTLLPKKRAPKSLLRLLDSTPAVGGTPLREMVQSAYRYQQQQLAQMPELKLQTYLITDGRTTQSVADLSLLGQVTVIDTEQGQVKRGKANQISRALFAEYFSLEELSLSFSHTLKA